MAQLGVTAGCSATPAWFCPDGEATRAQMAVFLVRAFDLEAAPAAGFEDTADSFAADIDALYAARVTAGCSKDPLLFCPDRPITRAQMAAFLYQARQRHR